MGLGTMFKANKAYRAQKNGDETEAMRLYEECFQEGLADPRYVLAYAVLMLRDGQYQKAKDFLVKHQKAPGMTPDQRVTLIVDYAACCYRLGDLDKGVRKLEEIYSTYGYCLNTLHSYEFQGSAGMVKMKQIMSEFHEGLTEIAGMQVVRTEDYLPGLNGLPKSDVLKFFTENGSVVVRPSGTEPKLKLYISVTEADREAAEAVEKKIVADMEKKL